MKEPALSSPSAELQKANKRLHKLRQQALPHKAKLGLTEPTRPSNDDPPWEEAESSETDLTNVPPVAKLPSHLGWGSASATWAIRTALHRHEQEDTKVEHLTTDHLPFRPLDDRNHVDNLTSDSHSQSRASYLLRLPLEGDTVKHYPTIGIAALKQEQAAIYRIWLLCRYLDEPGRGCLSLQDVREQLTGKESELRLFGWRLLRQILGQGHGRFWTWDKANGRVWLFGAARVAANLDVLRLTGKPVLLPVTAFTASIGEFKAHLYAAWHSGRKTNNPICRQVQESITSVPERTQRHYCQVARIKRQTNIAIGNKYSQEEVQAQACQRGRAVFKIIDHRGWQGRKRACYVAWHLPNSYIGQHQQTANGRMRKINRKLTDLVTKGARGNGGRKVEKMYHANGAEAGRTLNRNQVAEAYWPMVNKSRRCIFWAVFSLA